MPSQVLLYVVVLVLSVVLLTGLGEIAETLESDKVLAWKWHSLPGVLGLSACLPFQLLHLSWALSGLLLCICPLWSGWYRASRLAVTSSSMLTGWILEALYYLQTADVYSYVVTRALVVPLLASLGPSLPLRLRLLSHGVGLSLGVAAVFARPDAVTVSAGLCTALVVAHTSGALQALLTPASIATRKERKAGEGPACEPARGMDTVSPAVLVNSGERGSDGNGASRGTLDSNPSPKEEPGGVAKVEEAATVGVFGGQRLAVSDPQAESRKLGRRGMARGIAIAEGSAQRLVGEESMDGAVQKLGREKKAGAASAGAGQQLDGEKKVEAGLLEREDNAGEEEEEGDDFEERIMEQAAAPGTVRDTSETIFTGRPNASAALIGVAPDPAVSALLRSPGASGEGGSVLAGEPSPREAERGRPRPRGSLVLTNEERMATTTSRLLALAGAASGKVLRGGAQPGLRSPPAREGTPQGFQAPQLSPRGIRPSVVQSLGDAWRQPAKTGQVIQVSAEGLPSGGGGGSNQPPRLAAQGGTGLSRPIGLAPQGGSGLPRPVGLAPEGGSGLSQPSASRKGKEKVIEAESTVTPSGLRVLPGVSEREREALSATYAAVSAARAAEALGAARPWGTGTGLPTTELDYRAGGEGTWQSPRWPGLDTESMSWMQEMEFMGPGWDGGISRTDDEKALNRGVVLGPAEGGGDEKEEDESDEDEDYDFAKMEEKYRGLLGNMRGFGGGGLGADVSKGFADVSRGSSELSRGSSDVRKGSGDVSNGLGVSDALGAWGSGLGFAAAIASDESDSDEDSEEFSDDDEEDDGAELQDLGRFGRPGSYPVPDPNPAINPWAVNPQQQKQWLDAIARGSLPMPSAETGVFTPSVAPQSVVHVNPIAAPRFVLDASSPVLRVEKPRGEGVSQPEVDRVPPAQALPSPGGTGFPLLADPWFGAHDSPGATPLPRFGSLKVPPLDPTVQLDPINIAEGQVLKPARFDPAGEVGGRFSEPAAVRSDPVEELEARLLGPAAAADVEMYLAASERITQLLSAPAFTLDASLPPSPGPSPGLTGVNAPSVVPAGVNAHINNPASPFPTGVKVPNPIPAGVNAVSASAPGPVLTGVNATGAVPAGVNMGAFRTEDLLAASQRITQLLAAPIFTLDASVAADPAPPGGSNRGTTTLDAHVAAVPVPPGGSDRGDNDRGRFSSARGGELFNPSLLPDPAQANSQTDIAAAFRVEPEPAPSFQATAPPATSASISGMTGDTNRGHASRSPMEGFLPPSFFPPRAEPLRPTPASNTPAATTPPNASNAASLHSAITLRSGRLYPFPAKPAAFDGNTLGSAGPFESTESEAGSLFRGFPETGVTGNGSAEPGAISTALGEVPDAQQRGISRGVERPSIEQIVGFSAPVFTLDASRPSAGHGSGGVSGISPPFTLGASRPSAGLGTDGVFSPAFTLDASRPPAGSSSGGVSNFVPAFTLDASRPAVGSSVGGVSDFRPAFTLDASRPAVGSSGGGVSDFRPAVTLDASRPGLGSTFGGVSDFRPACTLIASRPLVSSNSGGVTGISPPVSTPANGPAGALAAPFFILDASMPAQHVNDLVGPVEAAPLFTLDASKGLGTVDVGNAGPFDKEVAGRIDGADEKSKADGYAWTQMTERLARRSNGRGMSKVDQEWLKVMARVKDKLPQMQVEWKPELHIPFDALGN